MAFFIRPTDLMDLEERPSKKAAQKAYSIMRAAFGKRGRQQWITVVEYAHYRGVKPEDVLNALSLKNKQ